MGKKKNKDCKSKTGRWVAFGIFGLLAVAAVAAWRASKPVDDPWQTPSPVVTPVTPTTDEDATDAESNSTSSDKK